MIELPPAGVNDMQYHALIYNRVSSLRQVKEGHGLETQNQRGITFALSKGYIYEKSFFDEGISGAVADRPAINQLLKHIDSHPEKKFIVVIDDLSRLARDVKTHMTLKTELIKRGVEMASPNFNFDNSPEGTFVETIMAAKAQFDREQNARQVQQKMKARMELGYWCLRSLPIGLEYKKDAIHGKIATPKAPYCFILKDTIEAYARGLLGTLEETRQYISKRCIEYNIDYTPSISGTHDILTELLYTGYLEYAKWGIARMKAKHEGFIDLDTFLAVQERLSCKSKLQPRHDYNADFPLRGFVICDSCLRPFTGAWVHGRSSKYPKYWCKNKEGCTHAFKSVSKSVIEDRFINLLGTVKPREEIAELIKEVLLDTWESRQASYEQELNCAREKIIEIEQKMSNISGLIAVKIRENDLEMVKIYEDELRKLGLEKSDLGTTVCRQPSFTKEQFRTASEAVMDVIKEPVKMWQSKEYRDKAVVLNMFFDDKLRYDIKEGFRTATLAFPIALMQEKDTSKKSLVEMGGVEPPSGKTPVQMFS